jgi:hypothetical protein
LGTGHEDLIDHRAAYHGPLGNGCSLDRKHLPPRHRVIPARMLKTRPTPSADRAPRLLAQCVRRRVGAPPDHEGHKGDGYAVAAGVAAQPEPVRLMQECPSVGKAGAGGRGHAGAGSSCGSRLPRIPTSRTNMEQACQRAAPTPSPGSLVGQQGSRGRTGWRPRARFQRRDYVEVRT